jgi:hypothetical protein
MTAIVQVAGSGSRIEVGKFQDAARKSATIRDVVAHHNEAMIAQIIRTVACNGKHVLEARLCRWLLMVHDRVNGELLNLTQEFLGQMTAPSYIGRRRAGCLTLRITMVAPSIR